MCAVRIGVLTSSDTRAAGKAADTSGKALIGLSEARGWEIAAYHLVPDDRDRIAAALVQMADVDACDIVFTTGGTGIGPRDVLPETTRAVADREVPGIGEVIRGESLKITSRAMLSRGTAGQRGSTLIINLPGSEKAVRESFGFVADVLEHAVEMMAGGGHG
ncbi:MAG: MogA/MoaB family molybdenum cofactor biosynthesis protein [Coriobacteriia bacterium]|nr:MogA/MoaB family molybdenum cofactor biosynthesis protein [Coriobacteriia bacterium]